VTELNPQISIALSSLRLEAPLLKQLSAGRNSRVWRVEARDRTAIVKEYFADHGHNQSRLAAECNFLDYLNSQGHSNIPRLLLRSDEENFAVFSFIGGSKVTQPEELLVTEAADFIIGINSLGDKPRAEQLGFAKDACKTISDHLSLAQVRIDALLEIKQQDEITRSMQHFVKEKIAPHFEFVQESIFALTSNQERMRIFDAENIIISPSDFGFHNMLLNSDGLNFLDFEYSGWDDIAKLICDFRCQPDVLVPTKIATHFQNRIQDAFSISGLLERVELLMPLHRLKWSCILLNEFRRSDMKRRQHAGVVVSDQRQIQLAKAQNYFLNALVEM
jgi:thiamine kinase-like enzyme